MNASRDVWTPTMPVYRAKGKKGVPVGSVDDGSEGCARAEASAIFVFREGIVEPISRARER